MTKLTLTREIAHAEQSSYIEIPFDMPEHVEEIFVSYQVKTHGDSKAVIDLGVWDGCRVRGWSGGARSEFRISREKATPGYIAGELATGKWAVLHNAYKVPKDGCTVTVTVEFKLKTARWLKGDLHSHTVHSDGSYTLEEAVSIMEELGCDFLATTDHNAISQNFAHPKNHGLVLIPGMEFTTNFGHSNFLGVADPLDDFRVRAGHMEDVHERLKTARERGAKIVINHPFCDYTAWLWDFDVDHDWVEVWNGPWTERNKKALEWWQAQLASGKRLVAIGGSDVHRPDPYVKHAMPCTWVYADSKTAEGVLGGIGHGHTIITYSPDGPFTELTCGSYRVGDVVPAGETNKQVHFRAEQLHIGDIVKLVSEEDVFHEVKVAFEGVLEFTIDAAGKKFVRAEVHRYFEVKDVVTSYLMAALTNPIYFEQ